MPVTKAVTWQHMCTLCLTGLTGAGKSVVATDVMWSDPAPGPGLVENEARGVGLLFGPDVTQVTKPSSLHVPLC